MEIKPIIWVASSKKDLESLNEGAKREIGHALFQAQIGEKYDRKNALIAADLLNDKVVPFFEEQEVKLLRMLTDRGSEYQGTREHHEYELYLSIEEIEHSYTKAYHPQTNGICERFHKTIQEEFYNIAFRTKIYRTLEELQVDLDNWLEKYNKERTHQGKHCLGQTPMECFYRGKQIAQVLISK